MKDGNGENLVEALEELHAAGRAFVDAVRAEARKDWERILSFIRRLRRRQ